MADRKYFKSLVTVEVLSADEPWDGDIADLAGAITDGPCSGMMLPCVITELTKEEMAAALENQASDPSFLIDEDEDDGASFFFTKAELEAVAEATGEEKTPERIKEALDAVNGTLPEIRAALLVLEGELGAAGGRGVELAEDIDNHRIALAVLGVQAAPQVRFEFDPAFWGGDYRGTGAFAYVPYSDVKELGAEEAFEKVTGHNRCHIIHYTVDELFTADGKPFEEDANA